MAWDINSAREFVFAAGRVLDRRLLAVLFDGAPPSGVVAALVGYRNPDGGFGHGLEPDKRAPASQPLDVELAFDYLVAAGADAPDLVRDACDWLETVATAAGVVPTAFSTIAGYPRAAHWQADEYEPGVNPTAAIAAHVHALGLHHPWVDRATDTCLRDAEAGLPAEAHDLLCLTKLLATAPDRARAERLLPAVAAALPTAAFMKFSPSDASYGLTPLDFAPSPTSVTRSWFGDDVVAAHLDALAAEQQPDGGWPIAWQPPGEASALEWRAIRTLHAMRVLRDWGHQG